MNTMAVLPMPLGEPSEVIVPGARSPGGGEPVDEGEGFLGMLQQLLVTGMLAPAPAVQQPVPVEVDAPVDLQSATVSTGGAVAGASGGPQAPAQTAEQPGTFSRTVQFSLPLSSDTQALPSSAPPLLAVAPLDVASEPGLLPVAGQVMQTGTNAVEEEAPVEDVPVESSGRTVPVTRMDEPERKSAMTQSTVAAAMLDLLDEAEPVRMADVPAVPREEIAAGRPPAESLSRDMTRTAVAEGMREYERQHTGNTRRAGARSVAAAPGVVRGESKPKPVFTTMTPGPDDAPKTIRSAQSASPVVDTFAATMPDEHRANVVIELRQSAAAPAPGAQANRAPEEVMHEDTGEDVPPDVKENGGGTNEDGGPCGDGRCGRGAP